MSVFTAEPPFNIDECTVIYDWNNREYIEDKKYLLRKTIYRSSGNDYCYRIVAGSLTRYARLTGRRRGGTVFCRIDSNYIPMMLKAFDDDELIYGDMKKIDGMTGVATRVPRDIYDRLCEMSKESGTTLDELLRNILINAANDANRPDGQTTE